LSSPFQNRLVGTIIVAAVVIIFLPDVLDGEKKAHQTDFEAIPKAPVFSGKLSNKNFPEEQLKTKATETIIAEEAQDHLLSNSIDNEISKITPANKNEINGDFTASNKVENTEKLALAIKSPLNKAIESVPEKAIAKEAWVIHLGSFKHKQNVAQLLAKLKSNGYTVFTQPIKTKQGTLTKVFVGPELIKSSLDKKLPALKRLTNTNGKVARFYPNK
jgi:DedD protein